MPGWKVTQWEREMDIQKQEDKGFRVNYTQRDPFVDVINYQKPEAKTTTTTTAATVINTTTTTATNPNQTSGIMEASKENCEVTNKQVPIILLADSTGQKKKGWHTQSVERRLLTVKKAIPTKAVFQKWKRKSLSQTRKCGKTHDHQTSVSRFLEGCVTWQ